MEIHSACDLLDDETDQSVLAYECLAFGRLSLDGPTSTADQGYNEFNFLENPKKHFLRLKIFD